MATWKKVLVSGSAAEVSQLNAGANQQISPTVASTFLSGSFSGSFSGNGAGLTGVTATAIFPTTAKTDLATTDQIYINDGANKYITYGNLVVDLAGSGAGTSNLTTTDTGDSLALTSQIAVTGVSASFTGSLTGALIGTSSWATNATTATTATTATNATNTAITDTTTGTGPYYVTFVDATSGNAAQRVDSTGLTYNATTNTITATASFAVSASRAVSAATADSATTATTATNANNIAVTDTTTGTGPYYITFADASTGNVAARVDSTGLTYNATSNTITATASYANQALNATNAAAVPWSGITSVPSGIVSASSLSSPSQGNAVLTTNGVAGSTIDLGLTSAASPSFVDLTLTGGDLNATTTTTFNLINANQTTVNFAGAATALNIGASTGTTTINNDTRIKGALYVDGTVTAISSSNLYVADQFILLASGSATNNDGGIVIDRGSYAAGNIAYGYDSTTTRWGFQDGVTDSTNTIDPTSASGVSGSFIPYLFVEANHGATKPTTGEFAVVGSMYMSTAGDFWIYTA